MRSKIGLLFTVLLTMIVGWGAQANFVTNYQFPYQDPVLATMTVDLLKSVKAPTNIAMPVLAGRNKVPLFEGRASLHIALYQQAGPQPAPLIYLIPGIAGTPDDGVAQYLAEVMYKQGYTVVIVNNPFSWQFVLARSVDAVPGYVPGESRVLYSYLKEVRSALQRYGVRTTSSSLVGYSLGAVNSGLIAIQDSQEHAFDFKRIVLINPPLDLDYALTTMDRLGTLREQLTLDQYNSIWGTALQDGQRILQGDVNQPSYFANLTERFPLSKGQCEMLVGDSFHQTLADMLFVSQQIKDRGLLKIPATEYQRDARENEALGFTFHSYEAVLALPFWQAKEGANSNLREFMAQADLNQLTREFAALKSVRMMHNADDFLTRSADLKKMDAALGERSAVYPHGGHVGNIWFPVNQKQLINFLQD